MRAAELEGPNIGSASHGGKEGRSRSEENGHADFLRRPPAASPVNHLVGEEVQKDGKNQEQRDRPFQLGGREGVEGDAHIPEKHPEPDPGRRPAVVQVEQVPPGVDVGQTPGLKPSVRGVGEPDRRREDEDLVGVKGRPQRARQHPLPDHRHRRRVQRQDGRPLPPAQRSSRPSPESRSLSPKETKDPPRPSASARSAEKTSPAGSDPWPSKRASPVAFHPFASASSGARWS